MNDNIQLTSSRRFTVSASKFFIIISTIILFILYATIYEVKFADPDSVIYCLSVLGWFSLLMSLYTWKKLTGEFFTLYSIFILFAYLFNFGQCLMWAIGIHFKGEIGTTYLYTLVAPSKEGIIQTQMLSLMGLIAFHCGALIVTKKTNKNHITNIDIKKLYDNSESKLLWEVCRVTLIISALFMYYTLVRDIIINRVYGYGATLYNEEVVSSQNNIIMLLRQMFFPSIVGILIGRGYNKSDKTVCYALFGLFIILSIFGGHRGTWIYPLIILIWMHHTFVKKISLKKGIVYLLAGLFVVTLAVSVRNVRGTGITFESIFGSFFNEDNPIVSAFFEMGGSMRPALIITEHGWGKYPYGNTYLLAILGMVTEKVIKFFIPNYIGVSSWFSQVYLGISYGAGFSMIAEALINYGPYVSIPFLMLLGTLYSRLIASSNIDINERPLAMFMKISGLYVMIYSVRNLILGSLKLFVFSTLLIYFAVKILKSRKKIA